MPGRPGHSSTHAIGSRLRVVVALVVALLLAFSATAAAAPPPGAGGAKLDVFVAFDRAPGPAERALVRGVGGSITYTYDLVPAIAASVPAAALDGLARNARVTRIEPDVEITLVDHSTELDNTWGVKHIGSGDAHHDGQTGSGVRVAVLDTGIMTAHADLAYDPSCSNGTRYGTVADGHGHGTHVAGTVAALKNGSGVVGVAPAADICVFKVLSDSGGGSFSDVVAALNWIVDYNSNNAGNPIVVTNNSYGASTNPGTTVRQAFDNAAAAGVLHVAAAGNSGTPSGNGSNCIFPARYDSVLAVAATDSNDTRARWSSTCSELELSAPGVSIRSTYINGGNATMSGTSMASPHVAGSAALVLAADTTLGPAEVRQLLKDTASPLGATNRYGAGLVQPVAALATLGGTTDPEPDPTDPEPDPTDPEPDPTDPEPVAVTVGGVDYATAGRWHLRVTITVVDDGGAGVAGAAVTATVTPSGSQDGQTASGTTGSDGTVTFQFNHALRNADCYTTTVTNVTGVGLEWNGETPSNGNC